MSLRSGCCLLTALLAFGCSGGQTGDPTSLRANCSLAGAGDPAARWVQGLHGAAFSPPNWPDPQRLPLNLAIESTSIERCEPENSAAFTRATLSLNDAGGVLFRGRSNLSFEAGACNGCYAASLRFSGAISEPTRVLDCAKAIGSLSFREVSAASVTPRGEIGALCDPPGEPPKSATFPF